jgi:hypothetical protein
MVEKERRAREGERERERGIGDRRALLIGAYGNEKRQ